MYLSVPVVEFIEGAPYHCAGLGVMVVGLEFRVKGAPYCFAMV